ncbi:MAG: hypothetical protein ABIE74_02195 [Pseudomonadota bacterium]
MKQLKDAFMKAGINPVKYETKEDKREKATKSLLKKSDAAIKKEHIQTICENCQKTAPDVERYNHRNRLIRGNWLCLQCADENSIDDSFRTTSQSTHSRQKMFRRRYGRTVRSV